MRLHLAQLNVAQPRGAVDSPVMADFVAGLAAINALADRSPGFVWRLRDANADDATALRPYGPDVMVNMSVWESLEALRTFVYRTVHLEPMRRRREWFVPPVEDHLVLWWIPAGTLPTLAEAGERLARLRRDGPSPEAFTFRSVPASREDDAAART
jgi:hypothetical protein